MTLGRCPLSIFCSRGTPPRVYHGYNAAASGCGGGVFLTHLTLATSSGRVGNITCTLREKRGRCLRIASNMATKHPLFSHTVTTGALPTGSPLSAKIRSYPHTGSACSYPTLTLQCGGRRAGSRRRSRRRSSLRSRKRKRTSNSSSTGVPRS